MKRSGIALMALVLVLGCTSMRPADGTPECGIAGTVLDENGSPVQAAPVGVIFDVHQGLPGWPPGDDDGMLRDESRQNVTIRFAIEEASRCDLRIYSYRWDLVKTLIDDEEFLFPGVYERTWTREDNSGHPVPNDLYRAVVNIRRPGYSERLVYSGILLNALPDDYEGDVGPNTCSDASGRFFIPFAALPLGEVHDPGPPEWTVPHSLWLKTATEAGSAVVKVEVSDPAKDLPVTLHLSR